MELNFRKTGEGKPFLIIHGLFGSLDNWQTFARQLSERGYAVYTIDARNHGQSPHTSEWDYHVMAQDIREFILQHSLEKVILMGHSMGGKTAMEVAVRWPDLLEKLIIVDIAPKEYPPHHDDVLEGLHALDLDFISSRGEAEKILAGHIQNVPVRQFLLKNLYWKEKDKLAWRFNLDVISENIDRVRENNIEGEASEVTTLFIAGRRSGYIEESDANIIRKHFPNSRVKFLEQAGHWPHAEAPEEFLDLVVSWVSS